MGGCEVGSDLVMGWALGASWMGEWVGEYGELILDE
jgi:hypothetical protein